MGQLPKTIGRDLLVPEARHEAPEALCSCLRVAAESAVSVVVVIDGVDRLDDRDDARTLWWLPPRPLPNVRFVMGSRPYADDDPIARCRFPVVEVPPLTRAERAQVVRDLLALYGKRLPHTYVDALVEVEATSNPRLLRTVVEELRVHGDRGTLRDYLEEYCDQGRRAEYLWGQVLAGMVSAAGVLRFAAGWVYGEVLDRFERDYSAGSADLLGDVLSALTLSRSGLTENDVQALLSTAAAPMPRIHLAPILIALEPFLRDINGRMTISDPMLRSAIRSRFLSSDGAEKAMRGRIAEFLRDRLVTDEDFAEYVWQMHKVEAWEGLYTMLADLPLSDPYLASSDAILTAWRYVESARPERTMLGAYDPIIQAPQADIDATRLVAHLLYAAGYSQESLGLGEAIRSTSEMDSANEWRFPHGVSEVEQLIKECRFDAAAETLAQEEAKAKRRDNKALQAHLALLAATVHMGRQEYRQVLKRSAEAKRLARSLSDPTELIGVLLLEGMLALGRGMPLNATNISLQIEKLGRLHARSDWIAPALTMRGQAWYIRRDYDRAVEVLIEAERSARRGYETDALINALLAQAIARLDRGDGPSRALGLLDEAAALARRTHAMTLVYECEIRRGRALLSVDENEEAAAAFALASEAAGAIGLEEFRIRATYQEGCALACNQDDWQSALERLREALAGARELGLGDLVQQIGETIRSNADRELLD